MPENYVLLERVELNAATASVTFANIPQTGYTDLKVVMSTRISATSNPDFLEMSVNGSLANFTSKRIQGNGASASSSSFTNSYSIVETDNFTANTFGNVEIYCPNYTSSNAKSFSVEAVTENNATTSYAEMWAWLWNQTASITSLGFARTGGQTFLANSTFSLYGVANLNTTPAIAPKASGGNIIENDGTYWIHTFLNSGTFTPALALSCDVLVVAGGGGGGVSATTLGGGGGAGGFRTSSSFAVTATQYPVTIGSGGAINAKGSDSIFSTITSTGGGFGGAAASAGNGGSGGGQSETYGTAGSGNTPSTSPSQGNNGGDGKAANTGGGGGGGGAGAVGTTVINSSQPGNGGNGSANSYSGSSVTYAGGGGGAVDAQTQATGGTGGGGAGAKYSSSVNATAGTINLGGGGGGGLSAARGNGAAGGSGIIIIRYPITA